MMNFAFMSKAFLKLYKAEFGLCDIKEADFTPILSHVLICFVVKTEAEKEIFLREKYEDCCKAYLKFMSEEKDYKNFNYEFMTLSKEEVKKKYDGSYYYAMF